MRVDQAIKRLLTLVGIGNLRRPLCVIAKNYTNNVRPIISPIKKGASDNTSLAPINPLRNNLFRS